MISNPCDGCSHFSGKRFESQPFHEWPPGIIDRALQADIWPDHIELEVSLGLSDPTVQMALKQRLPSGQAIAETPEQRTQQLQELVLAELCRVIELQIDGERVAWKPIRSELSSKHHILFFCYLEAPCQLDDQPIEIVIRDQSFPELQNQLRLALRSRRTKRLRANVEPLVIRSERIMLSELSTDDAQDARRMRALVAPANYVAPANSAAKTETPPVETPVEVGDEQIGEVIEEPEEISPGTSWVRIAVFGVALLFLAAGGWLWFKQTGAR